MRTLYINTCGKDVIIKYFKKTKLISEEIVVGQKSNSQFIMPSIKKVLNNSLPEQIVVLIGPGSFTGTRLGVTIAKTFGYVKNIPVKTMTTLEETAVSSQGKDKIVSIEENNGYFVGFFDKFNKQTKDNIYLSKDDYNLFIKTNKVIKNENIDYKKVIKYSFLKDSVNPHGIKPVYVKVIEALK